MTFQYLGGSNGDLFASPADWISPRQTDSELYKSDPPSADGRKVIIVDTDHLWGIGGNREWVWKSFLRGLNAIYMDPYNRPGEPPADESVRQNLGYTLRHASRVNLAAMSPRGELASSGYCLANTVTTGAEYLVYLPSGGRVRVNLSASPRELAVEWFNPGKSKRVDGRTTMGGANRFFTAPFSGDAVLIIWDAQKI